MADCSILAELLFEAIPKWGGKIEKYIKEYEDSQKPNSGIMITPSGVEQKPIVAEASCSGSSTRRIIGPDVITTPGVAGVAMPLPSPGEPSGKANALANALLMKNPTEAHLDSKPDAKSRFSSITSPAVMYDGESQHTLSEMWTALNGERGGLRREMMALKRRQQLALAPPPRVMPELIAADSDDGSGSDKDDDDMEHDAEMLRLRLKMEREKMKRMNRRGPMPGAASASMGDPALGMGGLQFKRARMMAGPPGLPPSQQKSNDLSTESDEKLKQLLEAIDENLDKACKVIETVAFVWLKGDPYDGHLKFIHGRLSEVAELIEESKLVQPKKDEQEKGVQLQVQDSPAMGPPLASAPSPRLEIAKKKSDLTMRDAPSLRMMPTLERQGNRKNSGSSSEDTVGPSMESIRPPLVKVPVIPGLQKANPHEPNVLEVEVDDDDEGIVC